MIKPKTPNRFEFNTLMETTRQALETIMGSKMADGKKTEGRIRDFLATQFQFENWFQMRDEVNDNQKIFLYPNYFGTYIRDHAFHHDKEITPEEALSILLTHCPDAIVNYYDRRIRSNTSGLQAKNIVDINEDFLNKGFVIYKETGQCYYALANHDGVFHLLYREKTLTTLHPDFLPTKISNDLFYNSALKLIYGYASKCFFALSTELERDFNEGKLGTISIDYFSKAYKEGFVRKLLWKEQDNYENLLTLYDSNIIAIDAHKALEVEVRHRLLDNKAMIDMKSIQELTLAECAGLLMERSLQGYFKYYADSKIGKNFDINQFSIGYHDYLVEYSQLK